MPLPLFALVLLSACDATTRRATVSFGTEKTDGTRATLILDRDRSYGTFDIPLGETACTAGISLILKHEDGDGRVLSTLPTLSLTRSDDPTRVDHYNYRFESGLPIPAGDQYAPTEIHGDRLVVEPKEWWDAGRKVAEGTLIVGWPQKVADIDRYQKVVAEHPYVQAPTLHVNVLTTGTHATVSLFAEWYPCTRAILDDPETPTRQRTVCEKALQKMRPEQLDNLCHDTRTRVY